MKFDDLPEEVKKFKEKIEESELLRFWSQPTIHTGGFSPCELWKTGNLEKRQEILALLERCLPKT